MTREQVMREAWHSFCWWLAFTAWPRRWVRFVPPWAWHGAGMAYVADAERRIKEASDEQQ